MSCECAPDAAHLFISLSGEQLALRIACVPQFCCSELQQWKGIVCLHEIIEDIGDQRLAFKSVSGCFYGTCQGFALPCGLVHQALSGEAAHLHLQLLQLARAVQGVCKGDHRRVGRA